MHLSPSRNTNYRSVYGLSFLVFITLLSLPVSSDYSVALELLQPVGKEGLKLKVRVVNLSGDNARVFKYRRIDYKRKVIRALGNYVLEIQQLKDNEYILFEPSADINPVFENQEYVSFIKGESIHDTLHVPGMIFSGKASSSRGFPVGQYRMRVYFNPDMWNCSERNGSDWMDFNVK